MIELSKCPNCASEDKVTIAGKDFCMRCGTPNADPIQADTANSSTQPITGSTEELQTNQSSASVSKFATPTTVLQQTASGATAQPTDQPITTSIPTDTINTTTPQTAQQSAAVPTATVSVGQPANSTEPPPDSNPIQAQASVSPALTPPEQLMQPPASGQVQANSAEVPTNQGQPAIAHPVEQSEPSSTTLSTLPEQAIPTPAPVQIPADQTLTQPVATPEPQSVPAVTDEPKIHTHQAIMSLDKNDSGIFSDEQLDELSKISEQSEPLGQSSIQPESVLANPDSSRTTTFHTDIQPPSNNIKPTQVTQPAVSKVVNSDIKTPDQITKGKKVLKPAGIALSIVSLFLVGAYIWQLNYPTLAFKIASAKAGISANMPGYMPGGYKLAGEIQTNPGSVSYSLVNGGQNRKISISQTKTDWDSQALAENYVSPKAENYLALQAQGLTIYMLGDSQATWVNKGTWYKIESPDQSLSQDQAIKIATSL